MPRRLSKSGFTLTEMLVVISIIGILAAISIPAVMVARNLANKAACANNLKEIGTAIKNYESNKNHLPPSFYDYGDNVRLNWIVTLLPYLEQQNLADQIIADRTNFITLANNIRIAKLNCPMDNYAPIGLSYAANCGRQDGWNVGWDQKGMGVFYDRSSAVLPSAQIKINLGDIYDGTTQTIMIAENSDAGGENYLTATPSQWNRSLESQVGVVWFETNELAQADIDTGNYVGVGEYFNDIKPSAFPYPSYSYARPASFHSQQFNVLFCDGSVKPVQRGLDYRIYCQMMTSDSRKIGNASRGYGAISD